jgi:hypothetical protein
MRRSAAFTLWRRHSFLMNPIITSHLTKWTNQGRSARRGPELRSCLHCASGCSGTATSQYVQIPGRRRRRRQARPDQRAVRAHPVSLGKRAVPKAQTVYARACPACPPGANGAMTQPPGAGPANATSGPSAGATTKPSRPPAGIWHLEQPEPGVMTWRLPSGRVYETVGDPY